MKKMAVVTISIIVLTFLTSCNSNNELAALRKENEELKLQLSTYQNNGSKYASTSAPNAQIGQDASISFGFIDVSEFGICLTDGTYRCGSDFEPGDYYVLSLYGAEADYDVSDTPEPNYSDKRIIRLIHAENGQYIKLSHALLIGAEDFSSTDLKKYGVFKAGTDFPAGEYKIEAIADEYDNPQYHIAVGGNLAAYQISSADILKDVKDCSVLYDRQSYLSLQDGEYIMINNAYLTKV